MRDDSRYLTELVAAGKLGNPRLWCDTVVLPRRVRTALELSDFTSVDQIKTALLARLETPDGRIRRADKVRLARQRLLWGGGPLVLVALIRALFGDRFNRYCMRLAPLIEASRAKIKEATEERRLERIRYDLAKPQRDAAHEAYRREQQAFDARTREAQLALHRKERERIERMATLYQTIAQREAAERAGYWPSRAVP